MHNMPNKVKNNDIIWTYLAQFANLFAGVISLPILVFYLTPSEINNWMVFITLGSFIILFEFGFQPTFVRNFSYVLSGAQNLIKTGMDLSSDYKQPINREVLINLKTSAQKIYRIISLCILFLFLPLSTYYIYVINVSLTSVYNVVITYLVFVFGFIFNFYYGYVNSMLIAVGKIALVQKVIVFNRSLFVLISVLMVILGYGLLSVAVANLITMVLGRVILLIENNKIVIYQNLNSEQLVNDVKKNPILNTISVNAFKLGATQLGAFFTQRGSILIAAYALSDADSAAYAIAITLVMALFGVSFSAPNAMVPNLSKAAAQNNMDDKVRLLKKAIFWALGTYVMGAIVIMSIAWLNNTYAFFNLEFIAGGQLVLLLMIVLLELNHSVFALFITTNNEVPFVPAALISGTFILLLGFLAVDIYGIWGLLIAQGIIQLLYNNWKWPWLVISQLRTSTTH